MKNDSDLDLYIAYLAKDMDLKLEYMSRTGVRGATHMHWGGGTPTLLSLKQLETIHEKITDRLTFETTGYGERSIEAFPDNQIITRQKLELLLSLGFNVISFGIQDFDSRIQKVINREHDPGVVRTLIEMAQDIGFRVHVDFCYGLPFKELMNWNGP